jgi:hypothetical protein
MILIPDRVSITNLVLIAGLEELLFVLARHEPFTGCAVVIWVCTPEGLFAVRALAGSGDWLESGSCVVEVDHLSLLT